MALAAAVAAAAAARAAAAAARAAGYMEASMALVASSEACKAAAALLRCPKPPRSKRPSPRSRSTAPRPWSGDGRSSGGTGAPSAASDVDIGCASTSDTRSSGSEVLWSADQRNPVLFDIFDESDVLSCIGCSGSGRRLGSLCHYCNGRGQQSGPMQQVVHVSAVVGPMSDGDGSAIGAPSHADSSGALRSGNAVASPCNAALSKIEFQGPQCLASGASESHREYIPDVESAILAVAAGRPPEDVQFGSLDSCGLERIVGDAQASQKARDLILRAIEDCPLMAKPLQQMLLAFQ